MLFVAALVVSLAALLGWRASRRVSDRGAPAAARAVAAVFLVVGAAFGLIALLQAFTVVPAGHVGVVDFFGTVSDRTLKAGINLVNPLARVVKFTVKTQELKEVMDVPSKEGLTVQLELSALYPPESREGGGGLQGIGADYVHVVLRPQFRSVARGVTASYDARALYTSEREVLAQTILKDLQAIVEPRGITVESTPLRKVGLPAGLTACDRGEAAGRAGEPADAVRPPEGEAGGGAQADRGAGNRRLPDDRHQGDQRAAPPLEGDRGDREDRRLPEHEGRHHRRRARTASPSSSTRSERARR